jgi:MFS family permease
MAGRGQVQLTTPSIPRVASPLPYRKLTLVLGAQLAYGMCWSTFLLLPKFLTTELHASAPQIGVVSAVPSLAGSIAVPFVGRWVDRAGRRPLIVLGSAMVALQSFGFAAVDAIGPLLFGLQLVYGLSFVIAFNAAATLAADIAPPDRLTHVLGIFGASNVITNAIAPAIFEPLAGTHGWKAVFVAAGVLGLCAFALALRLRDEPAAAADDHAAHAASSTPDLVAFVATMASAGAAFAVAFTFYQPFALSLGMHEVRAFFVGYASSVFVARVALGSLPDRIGRKRAAVLALGLYGTVVVAMSQLAPGTLALYGAGLGLAHGFFYPSLNALAVERSARSQRGRVLTYLNGGFQLGYTLGVLGFGWLAQRTGYPTIFVLGGAIVACAAIALARGPEPQVATGA